jgi:2-(1,2-epoxy-1,2-dihydrophenyl)acetyl-CoA isomerase
MIWRCVDDAALADETQALANRLAGMPSKALAETRRAFAAADHMDLSAALSMEGEVQRRLGMSHDYLEGVSAFFAKRAPSFTDR